MKSREISEGGKDEQRERFWKEIEDRYNEQQMKVRIVTR